MQITPSNIVSLQTDFDLRYQDSYGTTETWFDKVATTLPSKTKTNTYGWIERIPTMRKWFGPRVPQNLKADSVVVTNDPYELTVELDRDDIEDDNLGLFTTMTIPQLGRQAKKHPDQLIAAMLTANTITTYDGIVLFSASHVLGSGTTYSNTNALTFSAANFNTVWAAMVNQLAEDGQPLGVMPSLLVIPPQLKLIALQTLQSTLTANSAGTAGVENMLKGWVDILVVPELAASGTQWYLLDTNQGVKPIIHQVRRAPEFVTRDQLTDPKVFDQKKFTYGVDGRWTVAPTLPWLMHRGNS